MLTFKGSSVLKFVWPLVAAGGRAYTVERVRWEEHIIAATVLGRCQYWETDRRRKGAHAGR